MEYDAARQQVILFGGICGDATALGETWSWDGQRWRELHPVVSPPARAQAGMVYDPVRDQLVLFGGSRGGLPLADTWVWDASGWSERHPTSAPPAMRSMEMAFDPVRKNVLLVGGYDATTNARGGGGELFDMWSWDGSTWALVDARFARFDGAMATDPDGTGVVLFGGRAPALANDTSRWDGAAWAQLATRLAPQKRAGARLVLAGPDALLLFGGQGAIDPLGDTWLLRQREWFEQDPTHSPSARFGAALAYDAARKRVVLFGGTSVAATGRILLGDTWTWGP